MESNKTYNITVENDSDILVTVSTIATVEFADNSTNIGGGAAVFAGLVGDAAQFRTIDAGDSNITVTQVGDTIDIGLNPTSMTTGTILPSAHLTYDLGSPTQAWSSVYVGPGSLYIDGTKVLGSAVSGDIDITTDLGQNLNIQAGNDMTFIVSGPGEISMQSNIINLGFVGLGESTVNVAGTVDVTGEVQVGSTHMLDGSLEFTGFNQNGVIKTEGAAYLFAETETMYVGSFADFTQIQGSIITGNLTGSVTGTVSSLANHTTDNLAEGSNEYYTDAKVDARIPTTVSSFVNDSGYATSFYVDTSISNLIDSSPAALDTLNELAQALGDDPNFASTVNQSISEKLNTADFAPDFDLRLSTKTTDDLTEGSNLYHTTDRVRQAISMNSTNPEELSYDPITGVFSYVSPSVVTAANAITIEVRNHSGVTIEKGDAVYISGYLTDKVLVEHAQANVAGKWPATGLASGTMTNNTDGLVTVGGEIVGTDTTGFVVGDVVYLGSTPGEITNIRPSSANVEVQNIGKVARSHATGIIVVNGSGRANDVPNLDHLTVFIGNNTGYQKRRLVVDDILDIDTITAPPQAGQALVWDAVNLVWEPGDTAGVSHLNQLVDVSISGPGPQISQALVWNGNTWTNDYVSAYVADINYIGNVDTSGAAGGYQLTYNPISSQWEATAPSIGSISNATDVDYNSFGPPSQGHVLTWQQGPQAWVPAYPQSPPSQPLDLVASDVGYFFGPPMPSQVLTWHPMFNMWMPEFPQAPYITLQDVINNNSRSTSTATIPFYYNNQSEFPDSTTYHGAMAHSHVDGAMYFAHAGYWEELANKSYVDTQLGDISTALTAILGA